ncbi:hypothetical protein ACXIUS_20215 [Bosea thiooxidans]
MNVKVLSILASVLGPIAAATPIGAQEFLPAAQAVKLLADGRPWATVTPEGRQARLTFNPDGTGSFEGPITMSTSWSVKGTSSAST